MRKNLLAKKKGKKCEAEKKERVLLYMPSISITPGGKDRSNQGRFGGGSLSLSENVRKLSSKKKRGRKSLSRSGEDQEEKKKKRENPLPLHVIIFLKKGNQFRCWGGGETRQEGKKKISLGV